MTKISRSLNRTVMAAALMLGASPVALVAAAPAKTGEKVLHAFNSTDGAYLEGGTLATDKDGNLYGTASSGGTVNSACASGCGTVYKVAKDGATSVIYAFTGGDDGSLPIGGVVRDKDGNLYGTAARGGKTNGVCVNSTCGTVWKLAADGTFSLLYAFSGGVDGGNPFAGVILDKKGNLYGTTEFGGAEKSNCGNSGCGTVFEVSKKGKEKVLYSFHGYQVKDGYNPSAGVTLDKDGAIYGTTFQGGAKSCNCGTVFKLTPDGMETVLHSFSGSDGNGPVLENLVLDDSGNLYGTTDYQGPNGYGTVFKVSPKGKLTTLHAFTEGSDGGTPIGGVVLDSDGNLYGATSSSDDYNAFGVVYKLTPDGTETVLHDFTDANDGHAPYGGLLLEGRKLYGTTLVGGGSSACTNGCGTVYSVTK